MRIGFDAKRAFKNFTGLGNYSRSTIEIMATYYPDNAYYLYTPPYLSHPSNVFAKSTNIIVREPENCFWKTFHAAWRSFRIASQVKADKIDVFHGLSHELPVGIKNSGCKSVVTMHDLIVLRYPHLYNRIDRAIYLRKYHAACTNADLVIAISQQTKNDLIDLLGVDEHKIRLVYQGCDPQFYQLQTEEQKNAVKQRYQLPDRYILNVGTIEPRKSLVTVVRALAQLSDDIHLVVVGKATDYMAVVNKEIERLGLQNRICLLHKTAFNDFPAIYQQARAFVYPSIFEGFGIPILEALNSRVPVVAANTSSLPEVGGKAALYIQPEDDVQLGQLLCEVINDNTLRDRMITDGLEQALKFREEQIGQSLWKVYQELIK